MATDKTVESESDDPQSGDTQSGDTQSGDTVTWNELLAETVGRLGAAGVVDPEVSARRIVEEASGFEGAELGPNLTALATIRGVAQLDAMVARRCAGEPLQYVLGRWSFRYLDLMIDQRVLIPRPETEEVAGWAIDELRSIVPSGALTAVDLGTGSGAIGLSVLAEVDDVDVWLTDRSNDALAVARANLVGLSRRAARGRVVQGSWFEALPVELVGAVDLIVSNPPYVAAHEDLPGEVIEWEPTGALVAGESGDEDLCHLVEGAPSWLAPHGVLVMEMAPDQTQRIAQLASATFRDVEIRTDLSLRPRAVLARM